MTDTLSGWLAAGVLSALDVQVARALAALGDERRAEVHLAAAMASRQVRQGHVCLRLSDWLASAPEDLADDPVAPQLAWPRHEDVVAALADSSLVTGPGRPPAPLWWDGGDRLYLQRYHAHEERVVERIRAFARLPVEPPHPAPELLERLLPQGERAEQRAAVLGALGQRLSVLTGGPGTGKTSTVVRLLALYLTDALADGAARPPRIELLAPTGKAAARLGESIAQAVGNLPVAPHVRDALPRKARTVHSALGLRPGRYAARRDASRPLEAELVVVDEASMIDLSTMRRLLDAVPDAARVVLLGDADQLASVEAGATLGDLCAAARAGAPALSNALFELHESHRYAAGSGVGKLAELARQGDSSGALALLADPAFPDVERIPVPDDGSLPRALLREMRRHYAGLSRHDAGAQLAALAAFRVLCAHRRGPLGAEHVNREAARTLHDRSELDLGADYHGRPVLITENDPAQDLYNGDVAVVHRPAKQNRLQACLAGRDGQPRHVALARLPAHESVYAMSVHKSQGSEFDEVAIVLPARVSPVLSRELLYTAVTRARRAVRIYADEAVLRSTLATRVRRASGLSDALLDR